MLSKKRAALCIEAVNSPWTWLGASWIGLILGPALSLTLFYLSCWKLAIVVFFPAWLLPAKFSESEPYLVSALVRSMFYGDYYE